MLTIPQIRDEMQALADAVGINSGRVSEIVHGAR